MLQPTVNCTPATAFGAAVSVSSPPKDRKRKDTQYGLKPVSAPSSHPLILEYGEQKNCQGDAESMRLRAELEQLFPEDSHLQDLLMPILQGAELTARRRLELEACVKYPHVLDLQEAYVKRALGEELTRFEELLLRRMDGAVDCGL